MRRGTAVRRRGRTGGLAALTAALVLGLSACSAASHPAAKRNRATTTTAPAPTRFPLTGLTASDPSLLKRPVISAKVDNSSEARPQSGLDHADVVFQELIEGGDTRYLAMFQSQDADPLGPIRSVRRTDADIVAPVGGLFAYSGGVPPFVDAVRAAGVVDVGAVSDAAAYNRVSGRPAPHNLYTSTTSLRKATPSGTGPPSPLFDYVSPGGSFSAKGATPASSLVASFGSSSSDTWSWVASANEWQLTIGGVPQTDQAQNAPVGATNVIVQMVTYHDTSTVDAAGNPSPAATVIGTGKAVVLSGAQAVDATWSKPDQHSVTNYSAGGSGLRLLPGRTWVLLVPVGSQVTVH